MTSASLPTRLEAILYLKGRPVSVGELAELADAHRRAVEEALVALTASYAQRDSALEIVEQSGRYGLQLRPGMGDLVKDLLPVNLSTATLRTLTSRGFPCQDLSDNEFAVVHLRHMVGGRLPASARQTQSADCRELLYRFEFPERPGALMTFVSALHPDWSISIFHYRNHGADVGRIVVGVLVPERDMEGWNEFLNALGYPHWDETNNPAYGLFL